MPALKNSRHEAFAQQLVLGQKHGWSRGTCYSRAGYAAEGESAETNAWRLLKNAENGIAERVREIVGNGAKKAAVTVASLLNELDQARASAQDDGQFSAAVQAIAGKARLSGLDRENGGGGSEFARCETISDIMRVLLADETPAEVLSGLDQLRNEVMDYAAIHATVIPAVDPDRRRVNETEAALALFRPKHRH